MSGMIQYEQIMKKMEKSTIFNAQFLSYLLLPEKKNNPSKNIFSGQENIC